MEICSGSIGWYRKHFNYEENMKNKSFMFDGVYMDSSVLSHTVLVLEAVDMAIVPSLLI